MNIEKTIQYREGGNRLVFRHPDTEFQGAVQLIVNESQEALFFVNGQALDLFGAGRHLVGTHNYPVLQQFLSEEEKKENLFYGEVYFVNKTVQSCIKWGLPEKIRFLEPSLGVPFQIGISGEMFLQVSDARKLIIKLLGTGSELAWGKEEKEFSRSLQAMFLPVIAMAVRNNFADSVKAENIDIFTIDQYAGQFSETLRKKLLPIFEEYGLTIPTFMVENFMLPEGDPAFKAMRELRLSALKKAILEEETKQKEDMARGNARVVAAEREAELERKKTEIELTKMDAEKTEIETNAEARRTVIRAEAEAKTILAVGTAEAEVMDRKGVTGQDILRADTAKAAVSQGDSVAGIIVGAKIAKEVGEELADQMYGQEQNVCGECGTPLGKDAKFCFSCGNAVVRIASDEIVCAACGKTVKKGRFCSACGAPFEKHCPSCGKTVVSDAKFCANCGQKL